MTDSNTETSAIPAGIEPPATGRGVGRRLIAIIDRTSSITGFISGVTIVLTAILLVTEVIMRAFFNKSTLVADELSIYFFIVMLYFGLAYTLEAGRHIEIDIVTSRLKTGTRRYLNRAISLLNIPVFAVLCWKSWILVLEAYRGHEIAPTILRTPIYFAKLPIAIGMTIFLFQGIVEMLRKFTVKGADLKKGSSSEF